MSSIAKSVMEWQARSGQAQRRLGHLRVERPERSERTLLELLSDTARQRPAHPAVLFKGARLTDAELERLSNAFAAALVALGVKKGDRLALLLPNAPQFLIAQLGGWKAGGIVVPLNPLYSESEIEHALVDSGATAALVLTPFYAKLKMLQPRTAIRTVIATNIKEYLPLLTRLLFTATKERPGGHRITLQPDDSWLGDLLRKQAGAPAPAVPILPSDPALILFSGGTTGTPKGVVSAHGGLLAAGMQIHAWFRPVLVNWDDIVMAVMPFFHTYGNIGTIPTALVGHSPLAVVPNPRDLPDLLATVRQVRPAFLPGTGRPRAPRCCAAAGCTPATWATWTRTALCSSWIARRISLSRAGSRSGRARWKRSSRLIWP